MLVGVQMHITFDIDFDTLAGALELPVEEVVRLWNDGELKEKLDETMSAHEVLELCWDIDYYGGIRLGSAYH